MKLYNNIFLKYDATMVEINPMAEDNQGNGGFNNILLVFFSFKLWIEIWPHSK